MLRAHSPEHYRTIKAVFSAYCEKRGLTPFANSIIFERGGFSCIAEDPDGLQFDFRAVDAACEYCVDDTVDYCHFCGRHLQIDFKRIR